MHADEEIEGDRAFRIASGYGSLVRQIKSRLGTRADIRLNTPVAELDWRKGKIEAITAAGALVSGRAAVITLPLGDMKAPEGTPGVVRFKPSLSSKAAALNKLEMGPVIRVSLVFRERFWERLRGDEGKTLAGMSFLFSEDEWFPTWWTTMPRKTPVLTGWTAGARAHKLAGRGEPFIREQALSALNRLLKVARSDLDSLLVSAYSHDWESDPWSRGAYSYVSAGGESAEAALAEPIEGTLFFAGEATDSSGHNGTVHGALTSAGRAAEQILALPASWRRTA